MPRARYYISLDAGVNYSEFWPSNEPKVSYVKEGDEIFYRLRIDKFRIARTKNQAVYDSLYNRFFDPAYFATDILYKINILGVDKFFFIDPITSGNINTQDSVYDSTPDPNDVYRPILKQYERKWKETVRDWVCGQNANIYYPKLNTNAFINVNFDIFTLGTNSVSWGRTVGGIPQIGRNKLIIDTDDNDIVTVLITNYAGTAFVIELVDQTFTNISNQETVNANGRYLLTQTAAAGDVYVQMSYNAGATTGSFTYQIFYPSLTTGGGVLRTCLQYKLTAYGFGTVYSTILWNDALGSDPPPAIATYITANPTNDYVIEWAANWNNLWLTRVDSITTTGETLKISLKDIMVMLRKLRLYWFIDEDGNIRIEHEKYFRSFTPQADLTSATYVGDKPEVDQRIYNYEKEDSYSQLNYSEVNGNNTDWTPYPVEFQNTIAKPNAKDINYNVTTDFEYVRDNPSDASISGMMLLRTELMGAKYYIPIDQSGFDVTKFFANARLGLNYLILNYYGYFAEAETGTVNNGSAITYTHIKEYLKQSNVKFRMATDLDWKKPFILIEGTGWLEAAEYAPETGMYKISVGYNPYTIEIAIVDSEDMGIIITDSAGIDLIV
jgi:hypothetical protein